MATYDHVTNELRYKDAIEDFLHRSKIGIDDETKLITHSADRETGIPRGSARATSQTVILRTLPDIDPELARQQYAQFRTRFYAPMFGFPSVREYPVGNSGRGDVDSGTLFLGRSLSATVMTIGLAQMHGDKSLADAIAQSGEAVSCPWTYAGKRTYAFGLLPIGEQMVAYAYVARPWFSESHRVADGYPFAYFGECPFTG